MGLTMLIRLYSRVQIEIDEDKRWAIIKHIDYLA